MIPVLSSFIDFIFTENCREVVWTSSLAKARNSKMRGAHTQVQPSSTEGRYTENHFTIGTPALCFQSDQMGKMVPVFLSVPELCCWIMAESVFAECWDITKKNHRAPELWASKCNLFDVKSMQNTCTQIFLICQTNKDRTSRWNSQNHNTSRRHDRENAHISAVHGRIEELQLLCFVGFRGRAGSLFHLGASWARDTTVSHNVKYSLFFFHYGLTIYLQLCIILHK